MSRPYFAFALVGWLGLVACHKEQAAPQSPRPQQAETPELGELRKVGTVDFPTSCNAAVQPELTRGVALLHSFFYDEARRIFTSIAERDPQCAMAYWGIAMTWYHPIWAPPTDREFAAGRAAIERAQQIGAPTARERDYIAALATFYATPDTKQGPVGQGCHGPTDHASRAKAWSQAMAGVHERHPDDDEAAAFYALSLLGSAPAVDPTYKNQLAAAEILERLWVTHRDHPGVTHYLIHAYDFPPLARRGLAAAQRYASIAPWVPHALHMPSHIFTRLGMWQESIDSNRASAHAARAYEAKYHPGAANFDELHALDYLAYAYLQLAGEQKAREVVRRIASVDKTYPEVDFIAAYAIGAVPARFALERRAWHEAAQLQLPQHAFWAKFPFDEAHVEFARAIGRAKTGDTAGARRSLARLQELRDAITEPRFDYFKKHLDTQILSASALVAQAEGKLEQARALLEQAADAEDQLGKHPVSPGPVFPARELLGELLIEQRRPADALVAFEQSLAISPGRLNALYGAGRAAELAGQRDVAARYYQQFAAQASRGDGWRAERERARAFVAAR